MQTILLVVHVVVALAVVGLVLIQQGRGADAGAAFGSGASATVFGARGSANFLSRTTAILATVFFITSLSLAALSSRPTGSGSVVESVTAPAPAASESSAPAAAAPGTDLPPGAPASGSGSQEDVPSRQ